MKPKRAGSLFEGMLSFDSILIRLIYDLSTSFVYFVFTMHERCKYKLEIQN